MINLVRRLATILTMAVVVFLVGAFAATSDAPMLSTEVRDGLPVPEGRSPQRLTTATTAPGPADEVLADTPDAAPAASGPVTPTTLTAAGSAPASTTSTTTAPGGPVSSTGTVSTTTTSSVAPPGTTTTTTASSAGPVPTTTTTTTTTIPAVRSGSGMYLWDSAWQIAAKANDAGMQQYVDRLAAATGSTGANVTGFWFSVVNQNQDINTPNGFGHTFGSFSNPNADYLNDVERLIAKAAGRGLRVGILVAWDGSNQFSVESGKLSADNAYDYGYRIASQWTRPDFAGRWAISSWIMGGDTTKDNGGEHGAVWAEVVRGIQAAEAANGFGGAPILLHTAPGQQLHYLGAPWLDAHAPQTGHCADRQTAVNWLNELRNAGGTVWGNGEMRYEHIAWSCNNNVPISADDVLADAIAMGNLGYMANFVYGHDARWNSGWPGSNGMGAGGAVSEGLQRMLDEPGLIRSR